jgi:hypothetical protein
MPALEQKKDVMPANKSNKQLDILLYPIRKSIFSGVEKIF